MLSVENYFIVTGALFLISIMVMRYFRARFSSIEEVVSALFALGAISLSWLVSVPFLVSIALVILTARFIRGSWE